MLVHGSDLTGALCVLKFRLSSPTDTFIICFSIKFQDGFSGIDLSSLSVKTCVRACVRVYGQLWANYVFFTRVYPECAYAYIKSLK